MMEMMIHNFELNKPIYCVFSVLDFSKLWMYEFHYEKMTQWFEEIELCFTDSDSLLCRIEGEDIYKIMKDHEDDFDFSDYPFDHLCYSKNIKKVVGKFTDEMVSLNLEDL